MILEFLNGNSDQNSDKLINISITKLNRTENFYSKEGPSLLFQYSTHFITQDWKNDLKIPCQFLRSRCNKQTSQVTYYLDAIIDSIIQSIIASNLARLFIASHNIYLRTIRSQLLFSFCTFDSLLAFLTRNRMCGKNFRG